MVSLRGNTFLKTINVTHTKKMEFNKFFTSAEGKRDMSFSLQPLLHLSLLSEIPALMGNIC